MDFKTFYAGLDKSSREELACRLDTSANYLAQLAGGHRFASRKLAERMERATGGRVTAVEMLFPAAGAAA